MNTPSDSLTPDQLADAIGAEVQRLRQISAEMGRLVTERGLAESSSALTALSLSVRNLSVRMNAKVEEELEKHALFRDNIFMLAHRMRRNRTPENVAHCITHTIRLCDEQGAKANILRDAQQFVEGEGHWVGSHKYTEMQLAHIRACESHRWRVDDDNLGYVWEPFDRPSPSRPAGGAE